MSKTYQNIVKKERIQHMEKQVTVAMLTASATYQSFDFPAALPDYCWIEGGWIEVVAKAASTGAATAAAKTFGNAETYSMTDGMTVLVAVDGGGEDTATFNFSAGSQECTTYFPVSDLDGTSLTVSVDGGDAQTVTFATPCTTSAHVRAQIAAQTTGLTVSQASTAKAAVAFSATVTAPFNIANGLTVICDVDDAGADTATFTAARAVSAGSGLSIVDIDGETLLLKIDGGSVQTITFGSGDTDADKACATINAQLVGGYAVVNTGEIDIYTDTIGTGGIVEITGGTAATELGQSVAENTEATSDAVDCTAVTIAEVKTWLEAALTGSSGVTVADVGGGLFSITSNTTGVDSEIDIQASTALTALGLSVATVIGTADQPKLTSDLLGTDSSIAVTDVDSGLTWASAVAGAGDAADSTAVTAAEVNACIEGDIAGVTMTIDTDTPVMTSDTTGASSSLNFGAGTANTVLGLADETITGADAVAGTATADLGVSGGDKDRIIDGADITSATGNVDATHGVGFSGYISGGEILAVRVDSNVNVVLLETCDITAHVFYRDVTRVLHDAGVI